MPTIDRLTSQGVESVPLKFGPETLTVEVATGKITGKWLDEFTAAGSAAAAGEQAEDGAATVVDLFTEVLIGWDLFERDPHEGEDPAEVPRLPITADNLNALPVGVWTELGAALRAKVSPPEANAGGSFGG